MAEKVKEVYLGDGLYASFDGVSIRLRAPRGDGDHEVFLEPDVFNELLRYANTIWGKPEDKKDETG